MKKILDYSSGTELPKRPRFGFWHACAVACICLSLCVLIVYLNVRSQAIAQSQSAENYASLGLLIFKPIAICLNAIFLFGYAACLASLGRLRWQGLVGLGVMIFLIAAVYIW